MVMNEVMNGMVNSANVTAAQAVEQFGTGVQPVSVTPVTNHIEQEVETKPYQIRALGAKDIFPMIKIISKIGLKDFGKCFEPDEIKAITDMFSENENTNIEDMAEIVGVSVVLKIVDIILEHLSDAEQEIFAFLAGLIGKTAEDVANLPMDVFFELLIDVFKRKEFVGFMRVVSKLVK